MDHKKQEQTKRLKQVLEACEFKRREFKEQLLKGKNLSVSILKKDYSTTLQISKSNFLARRENKNNLKVQFSLPTLDTLTI